MAKRKWYLNEPDSVKDGEGDDLIAPRATAVQIVDCVFVNIRQSPSVSSESVKIVPAGTVLDLVSTSGSFYEVGYNSGLVGYILKKFCKEVSNAGR